MASACLAWMWMLSTGEALWFVEEAVCPWVILGGRGGHSGDHRDIGSSPAEFNESSCPRRKTCLIA